MPGFDAGVDVAVMARTVSIVCPSWRFDCAAEGQRSDASCASNPTELAVRLAIDRAKGLDCVPPTRGGRHRWKSRLIPDLDGQYQTAKPIS